MIYRARTENTDVFIAMYETEEPKKIEIKGTYSDEWKQWQSSKREYKVKKEYKEKLKKVLYVNSKLNLAEFSEAIEKGIDCTFLKNRLKEGTEEFIHPNGASELITVWTLLPLEDREEECVKHVAGVGRVYMCVTSCAQLPNCKIKNLSNLSLEDKKENETEVWIELMQEWEEASNNLQESHILDYLKSKFIVTRKPNIQEPE